MNVLELMQNAAKIYLDLAYPDGPSKSVREKMQAFALISDDESLLASPLMERENTRYCMRLGNAAYPHMKLTFSIEDKRPVFYVDAHDSHFSVSKDIPGYDRLVLMREQNQALKKRIERSWKRAGIPIFGEVSPEVDKKKTCTDKIILAIDDEVQILDILGIIVQSLGAKFLRAQSISDAKRICGEREHIDAIFCDVMMPEESGYDFVAWLKQEESTIPVYFITGLTAEHVVADGVQAILQKPFSAKSILRIIRKLPDN